MSLNEDERFPPQTSLSLELARENRELKKELEQAHTKIAELQYQIRCYQEMGR